MTGMTAFMDAVPEYIAQKLGDAYSARDRAFNLVIPLDDALQCEAVYDPSNSRLKLYGVTGPDFVASDYGHLLHDPGYVGGAYSKLIIYAYPGHDAEWDSAGFSFEGTILGYFVDSSDAMIRAAYLDMERGRFTHEAEHDAGLGIAQSKNIAKPALWKGYSIHPATVDDSTEISGLLELTFEDYPTPIGSAHIRELIASGSNLFRFIRNPAGDMVAAASAEIDYKRKSAELTDCATVEDERGRGHMSFILSSLDGDLGCELGITGIYSLARAGEIGMNCTFAKLGYIYTGRLRNNCRMPGGWESMNIWCKPSGEVEADKDVGNEES